MMTRLLAAQDSPFPLRSFSTEELYWESQQVDDQREYWVSGKVKIEYELLHDSIRLRKEYYESGNLKLTAEVFQNWSRLTIYTISSHTYADTIIFKEGYRDILQGQYREYEDGIGVGPYLTGQYKRNVPVGEWTKWQLGVGGEMSFHVVNYNDHGYIVGPYFEYYRNYANNRANIMWKGHFEVVTYSYSHDPITGQPMDTPVQTRESVRSGGGNTTIVEVSYWRP
jgi:hypothetical protein